MGIYFGKLERPSKSTDLRLRSLSNEAVFLLACETCHEVLMDTLTHPKDYSTIWWLAILQLESHTNHFHHPKHTVSCIDIKPGIMYPAADILSGNPWQQLH